jgi:nicotinate-nucleotide adenylyltransferase
MKQQLYRIGLMGGSFDPVHYGHLRAGEEIQERFDLDVMNFIPTMISPNKRSAPMTDAQHRVEMLRRAIRDNGSFRLSEVEIARGGVSYLFDTLREYRSRCGTETHLFFVLGMDSFLEMATWHRYADLFSLSNFIIMTRPGYHLPVLTEILSEDVARRFTTVDPKGHEMEHESGNRIFFEKIPSLEISATGIREKIASGRSVRYLLPDSVLRYIQDNHLYSQGEQLSRK